MTGPPTSIGLGPFQAIDPTVHLTGRRFSGVADITGVINNAIAGIFNPTNSKFDIWLDYAAVSGELVGTTNELTIAHIVTNAGMTAKNTYLSDLRFQNAVSSPDPRAAAQMVIQDKVGVFAVDIERLSLPNGNVGNIEYAAPIWPLRGHILPPGLGLVFQCGTTALDLTVTIYGWEVQEQRG